MRCEIKKGIFVLRACDTKAFVVCGLCRRPVCPEHIDKSSASRVVCVECAAQEYVQTQKTQHGKGYIQTIDKQRNLDTFWYYMTRTNFHTSHSQYRPFTAREQREFDHPTTEHDHTNLDNEASSFLDS
jgi:hypothetical protein